MPVCKRVKHDLSKIETRSNNIPALRCSWKSGTVCACTKQAMTVGGTISIIASILFCAFFTLNITQYMYRVRCRLQNDEKSKEAGCLRAGHQAADAAETGIPAVGINFPCFAGCSSRFFLSWLGGCFTGPEFRWSAARGFWLGQS